MRIFLAVLVITAVAACRSTPEWTKPGVSEDQKSKDIMYCSMKTNNVPSKDWSTEIKRCMAGLGYEFRH